MLIGGCFQTAIWDFTHPMRPPFGANVFVTLCVIGACYFVT